MSKEYPLILTFYLDRELMENIEIMSAFADHVDRTIQIKEANIMAFFLPTDGEERIECINPIQVEKADMDRINAMVEDISKQFDMGQGADEGKNDEDYGSDRLIARGDDEE